jgi:hypothetical protein
MHADTETDLPEENRATLKEAFFAVCPDERMTFEMFAREGPAPVEAKTHFPAGKWISTIGLSSSVPDQTLYRALTSKSVP